MKKRVSKRYLNRKKSHSRLLLQSLLLSLLENGHVETVLAKAKILKSYSDQELSYCISEDGPSSRGMIEKRYGNKKTGDAMIKYCVFLRKNFSGIGSGFTSIVRTRNRAGDNAVMAEVVLIGFDRYAKSLKPEKLKKITKKAVSKKKVVSEKKPSAKQKKLEEKKLDSTQKMMEKGGLLSRLKGRILGRKVEDPNAQRQRRARSRSGI